MTLQEKWLPVPGFPDYSVSDLGRVVSHKKPDQPRELRGGVVHGYRRVVLHGDDGRAFPSVHSIVASAFIGPRPAADTDIRHLDGDRQNNRLVNLAYGSRSENMQDAVAHGTHPQASKTHCKRNHEFTPENTYVYRGGRFCRACKRVRAAGIEVAA